jgi:hypothetical protein
MSLVRQDLKKSADKLLVLHCTRLRYGTLSAYVIALATVVLPSICYNKLHCGRC